MVRENRQRKKWRETKKFGLVSRRRRNDEICMNLMLFEASRNLNVLSVFFNRRFCRTKPAWGLCSLSQKKCFQPPHRDVWLTCGHLRDGGGAVAVLPGVEGAPFIQLWKKRKTNFKPKTFRERKKVVKKFAWVYQRRTIWWESEAKKDIKNERFYIFGIFVFINILHSRRRFESTTSVSLSSENAESRNLDIHFRRRREVDIHRRMSQRCQFHQCLICTFFVRKCFAQHFSNYSFAL